MARLAEAHGLFGVVAGTGDPRTAITAAVYASTATDFTRVIVRVLLGQEHPVTIAEEVAVLDNVNNGRTVVLADTGDLGESDAADEIAVLREALGNRPLQHEGPDAGSRQQKSGHDPGRSAAGDAAGRLHGGGIHAASSPSGRRVRLAGRIRGLLHRLAIAEPHRQPTRRIRHRPVGCFTG